MQEQVVKYTVDIDSMDKIVPYDMLFNPVFDKSVLFDLFNPYEIKVLFGRKQEKVMIGKDNDKDYYIINPYITKDFKNVSYIKILNCVFPRYYNTLINSDKSFIKSDVLNQRFIIMKIDIDNNTKIYSTNSSFSGEYIKLKVKYCPNNNDRYVILEPLYQNKPFYFKSGNLINIDRLTIKFFDDNYKPISLNFDYFIDKQKIINHEFIQQYFKDHAVNINFEFGCYENNFVNPNDY